MSKYLHGKLAHVTYLTWHKIKGGPEEQEDERHTVGKSSSNRATFELEVARLLLRISSFRAIKIGQNWGSIDDPQRDVVGLGRSGLTQEGSQRGEACSRVSTKGFDGRVASQAKYLQLAKKARLAPGLGSGLGSWRRGGLRRLIIFAQ